MRLSVGRSSDWEQRLGTKRTVTGNKTGSDGWGSCVATASLPTHGAVNLRFLLMLQTTLVSGAIRASRPRFPAQRFTLLSSRNATELSPPGNAPLQTQGRILGGNARGQTIEPIAADAVCKGVRLNDNKERGLTAGENDPDAQLMLRVRDDDAMAFQELVQSYQLRLLRILRHMMGSNSTAEDLVQDVFLRVWRARGNYQPSAKFSTWIFHIAHNVASNALRDRHRKREVQVSSSNDQNSAVFSLDQMAVASTGMMPVRKLDKAERADMVRTAVEALNERQRTALILCKFEGLSYQEIADTMELSVQAVKSLLSRARVNLKTLLEPYLDEGLIPGTEAQQTHDE